MLWTHRPSTEHQSRTCSSSARSRVCCRRSDVYSIRLHASGMSCARRIVITTGLGDATQNSKHSQRRTRITPAARPRLTCLGQSTPRACGGHQAIIRVGIPVTMATHYG
jgi:hypothetical protein